MILLDGKKASENLLSTLHFSPNTCLHVILVGNNLASLKYVALKQKKCQELGIKFSLHHFPQNIAKTEVLALIHQLNQDISVTGFFIQLPFPYPDLLNSISPLKDVDGLNPNSKFTPAVVVGIIKLLNYYHLDFSSKKIVIINDSNLIGQPLKRIFPNSILCNDQTKNLPAITQTADLLISATGVNKLVTADMVKEDATVIDVANGDVDFQNVAPKCSYITPTYGGVGPMTIASLLYNLANHENPTL